ncbi:DUF29 domain-containing protein [Thiothrix subterranea]|uniref:DUF29 domain-containing protein n=1 Tax=Thiothrix subterranea TaxID=2735563 RepID=A0AA51R4N2_9GAMM|nr:DUF29 domain-containing protein [Thiothrix subterranea]MDQ5770481.1 DUF29 domain-containing protein [Thiothrix subterranea]WML86841.1 DUF29 domain-containing protein [Thiothrix subterranea]
MGAIQYETDYYGWTLEQAELIKSKRLDELDFDHLLEELESMGASEKRELLNRLRVLLMHLLKWQYQPEFRGRSWVNTIREQRRMIPVHLKQNPSLKGKLDEFMLDGYELGRGGAADETGLPESTFPPECPWSFEQAMNPDFMPD